MRRAQVNAGSQPVRNLYQYPSSETAGSTVTVRTNFHPNPGAVSNLQLSAWEGTAPNTAIMSNPVAAWALSGFSRKIEWTGLTGNAGTGDFGVSLQTAYGLIGVGNKATVRFRAKTNRNVTLPAPAMYAVTGTTTQIARSTGVAAVAEVPFEVWVTFTADATATGNGLRVIISSWSKIVGDTIEYSDIDVYAGDYEPNRPWVSGVAPAAGDFTYAWVGTANASSSIQRAADSVGKTQQFFAASISSTDWCASGTKSIRIVPNGLTGESFFSILGSFGSLGPLVPGRTYTVLGTVRLTAPLTGALNRPLQISWRENGTRLVNASGANVTGVQQVRLTFTVGLGATNGFIEFFNGALPGGGDVWWDNIMVAEGVYTGDFIDPNRAFAKWDGTANASTSVGYPPQLLDLAGAPELDLTVPATTVLPGGFGDAEGRTFYTVFDGFVPTVAEQPMIVLYGATALDDVVPNSFMTLRRQGAATQQVLNRRTGGAGPLATVRPYSTNVIVWGMDGTGNQFARANNAAIVNPGNQVMAVPHQKITIGTASTQHKHIRTLMYRGYHSDTTQQAISRYLGNKYGALVA